MIGEATYSILAAASDVTDLVSTRIYPELAPENVTLPYVVFSVISTIPSDIKDGGSPIDRVNVQLDIYASTTVERDSIGEATRTALDRFSGTAGTVSVQSVRFDGQTTGTPADQLRIFWLSQDYVFRLPRT